MLFTVNLTPQLVQEVDVRILQFLLQSHIGSIVAIWHNHFVLVKGWHVLEIRRLLDLLLRIYIGEENILRELDIVVVFRLVLVHLFLVLGVRDLLVALSRDVCRWLVLLEAHYLHLLRALVLNGLFRANWLARLSNCLILLLLRLH